MLGGTNGWSSRLTFCGWFGLGVPERGEPAWHYVEIGKNMGRL